jgi:hypothetical protein
MRLSNSARIDDYCMRAPAPPLRFSLLGAEVEVMVFAMRHGVPSIGVPCVPWCKGKGTGDWHKYNCIRCLSTSSSSFFSFLARPVKPGADLLVCFILLPFFFFYSPLIEPGALNSQKLILSIITLAHITAPPQ